jgi:hypothetical protein
MVRKIDRRLQGQIRSVSTAARAGNAAAPSDAVQNVRRSMAHSGKASSPLGHGNRNARHEA